MMRYYGNNLAVDASWLISNGVMTDGNYRKLTVRKDIRVVRRGCRGRGALVDYESLPERFKRKVDEIVKDPYKAAGVNMVEERIEPNVSAADYFDAFTVGDDRHLPSERRRQYYADAVVLDSIGRVMERRKAKRHALGHASTDFWESISDAVQALDTKRWPHKLPTNARSLERKWRRYKEEGYESLVHDTYKTQRLNAAKVETDEQVALMGKLLSDGRNLDNAQVSKLYNTVAGVMGWKAITAGTVGVWRDKLDYETIAGRRGGNVFNSTKAMQVRRKAPEFPLCYWTMDGWDVELMYKETAVNNKGHNVTSYYHRPTVIVVLDACCKYPIGYAIGTHETVGLNIEAMRNAALHTETLFGQMYRVGQLQSDHYGNGKMTPLYEAMSGVYTPARVGNAKSKVVEPYWKYLNKTYCQIKPNWSGFGVTSRKELQPSSDFANKHKGEFPDYAGVRAQVEAIIEAERREKRDAYMKCFEVMPFERRLTLPYDQYLMMYGETTGHRNLLQGSGLNVTINGIKRHYDCFDPHFREHASVRWEVRYDPIDLRRALAVNEDESLRFELEEKPTQPMAIADRQPGDYEQLRRVLDFNKGEAERMKALSMERDATVAELLGGRNAELDTLQKLLICDSDGQHKNERNKARLSRPAGGDGLGSRHVDTQHVEVSKASSIPPPSESVCLFDLY